MSFPHSRKPAHEIDQAGGAYVRRRLNMGGEDFLAGAILSAEQIAAIPRANLNALINTGVIEIYPAPPDESGKLAPKAATKAEAETPAAAAA